MTLYEGIAIGLAVLACGIALFKTKKVEITNTIKPPQQDNPEFKSIKTKKLMLGGFEIKVENGNLKIGPK